MFCRIRVDNIRTTFAVFFAFFQDHRATSLRGPKGLASNMNAFRPVLRVLDNRNRNGEAPVWRTECKARQLTFADEQLYGFLVTKFFWTKIQDSYPSPITVKTSKAWRVINYALELYNKWDTQAHLDNGYHIDYPLQCILRRTCCRLAMRCKNEQNRMFFFIVLNVRTFHIPSQKNIFAH